MRRPPPYFRLIRLGYPLVNRPVRKLAPITGAQQPLLTASTSPFPPIFGDSHSMPVTGHRTFRKMARC